MKKRAHNEETKKEYRRIKTTIFYDGKRARTRVTSNQSERERAGKKKMDVMGYACHLINSARGTHSTVIGLTHLSSTHISAIV